MVGSTGCWLVLLKPLYVRRVQRYLCVNLSKPAFIQLKILVCAVLSHDCIQAGLKKCTHT